MSSFKITMKDETGAAVQSLEACIRGAGDWSGFWADKNGPISQAWAESRRVMFATQGRSTGTPWPDYTDLERRYYVPVKKAITEAKRVTKADLLRWGGKGDEPGAKERLMPAMGVVTHREYIYRVEGNTATMGTSVPYARNHNLGVGFYRRKVSAAKVEKVEKSLKSATRALNKAKTAAQKDAADARWEKAHSKSEELKQHHRNGALHVPTPKRPLLAFGRPFITAVRRELQMVALKSGGKIGITSKELRERAKVARAARGVA